MSLHEFDIIERFFQRDKKRSDIVVDSGDDCAVVALPAGNELVFTMDTLIAGTHFLENTAPEDIGYKALAVNLSDLAACGANPRFVTMSIALPQADESWLEKFCDGFYHLADQYDVALVGGDLVRGNLSITIQAHGFIPQGKCLKRRGAKIGDIILVTGYPGHAAMGLNIAREKCLVAPEKRAPFLQAMRRPTPRVATGIMLRDFATSCIDVSDGLCQDLSHIMRQNDCGININIDTLPISAMTDVGISKEQAIHYALSGGDDYELAFSLPVEHYEVVERILQRMKVPFTVIGQIVPEKRFRLFDDNNQDFELMQNGFQHF